MIISLMSCTGSPGVTTAAIGLVNALASNQGAQSVALAEIDLSGGVLATRYEMSPDIGLVSLGVQVGSRLSAPVLFDHAQPLPELGHPVLLAPISSATVTDLVTDRADLLGGYLADVPITVVADLGRVSSRSPVLPVLAASSLIGVLVEPTREHLHSAATTIREIEDTMQRHLAVGVVIAGQSPYTVEEMNSVLGHNVIAELSHDIQTASALAGKARLKTRGNLMRSLQELASEIIRNLPLPGLQEENGVELPPNQSSDVATVVVP